MPEVSVDDRLAEMARELALLRQRVSAIERTAAAERALLERELVAAVVAEDLHQNPFLSAEIVDYANEAPRAFLLRATLQRVGAETPVKLGKMLQKMEGRAVGAWVVRNTGRVGGGVLWQVENYVGAPSPTSTP